MRHVNHGIDGSDAGRHVLSQGLLIKGHGEERGLTQVGSSKKPVSYFDKPVEPVEEKKGGFSAEDKELIKAMMKKEEMEVKTLFALSL